MNLSKPLQAEKESAFIKMIATNLGTFTTKACAIKIKKYEPPLPSSKKFYTKVKNKKLILKANSKHITLCFGINF